MTTRTLARETVKEVLVGMGQISAGKTPQRMKAVLGSCIGLVLYHPRLQTGVMAHIVLPDSAGRTDSAGKFADTAVPEMLKSLRQLGAPGHGLTAKFAGGANMFGSNGPLQVGDANAEAVLQAVRSTGARLLSQDCGGNKGRRVIFDCTDGTMTVERAGQPPRVI